MHTLVVQETYMIWAHGVISETSITIIGVKIHQMWDNILSYSTALSIRGQLITQSPSDVLLWCFMNFPGIY